MNAARGPRWVALALGGAVAAWGACNGHLDFAAGGGGAAGRSGGTSGTGVAGPDSGAGGGAGATTAGPGGAAGCSADTDCRLAALHCDVGQGRTCVECTADQHCTRAGVPRCDLSLRRCVPCLVSADCATGQRCLGARCITTCVEDAAPACPAGTSCESGLCAACEADDGLMCTGAMASLYCLAAAPICVGCRDDGDCAGGTTPRCDPVRRTCVVCASSTDCSAGAVCDPASGSCVTGS